MSDNQLIELATVTDQDAIADSERALSPVIASAGLTKNWLSYCIKEGIYQATDIKLDGVPMYRFFLAQKRPRFCRSEFLFAARKKRQVFVGHRRGHACAASGSARNRLRIAPAGNGAAACF